MAPAAYGELVFDCVDYVCGKIVNGFRLDNGIIKSAGSPERPQYGTPETKRNRYIFPFTVGATDRVIATALPFQPN